jgi:hypothetical protein
MHINKVREYQRGNTNGKSRETGNIGYTRPGKQNKNTNTKLVGHHYAHPPPPNNVISTRTLLQKQLQVKTNRTSFLCGNRKLIKL